MVETNETDSTKTMKFIGAITLLILLVVTAFSIALAQYQTETDFDQFSDDFSIKRINKNVENLRKSDYKSSSEKALIDEMDDQEVANTGLISESSSHRKDVSLTKSMSLKLDKSVTTNKPKVVPVKVNTIKLRRTTTTTSTTTTAAPPSTTKKTSKPTTTTRKSNTNKKKQQSRKSSNKSSKSSKSATKTSTTTTTTTASPATISSSELESIKSKIRKKELEFLLNKVEALSKQQLHSDDSSDLLMENSYQEKTYKKPNIEFIPFNKDMSDSSHNYDSKHSYDVQQNTDNSNKDSNPVPEWPPMPHFLPPLPPPPPLWPLPPPPPPPLPLPPVIDHNVHNSAKSQPKFNSNQTPFKPMISSSYRETDSFNPRPAPNMGQRPGIRNNGLPPPRIFNGVLPIPNKHAIKQINNGDHHMSGQESHQMPYRVKPRGYAVPKSEKPGIQLSFGGGPMGGGTQVKTSPMGIFKTLLLPLLPKPRMNLNGKVVFGVVLENGVGFGKKPKIVAQHFSTGHI